MLNIIVTIKTYKDHANHHRNNKKQHTERAKHHRNSQKQQRVR